jgi:hypothetical protein
MAAGIHLPSIDLNLQGYMAQTADHPVEYELA